MNRSANRFVITKGFDNNFVFTIKQNGTTDPMVIDPTDTFVATIMAIDDTTNTPLWTSVQGTTLTVTDTNGEITMTVPAADTASFTSSIGDPVDRYYLKPNYRIVIDCVTVNNGNFLVKVDELYVD